MATEPHARTGSKVSRMRPTPQRAAAPLRTDTQHFCDSGATKTRPPGTEPTTGSKAIDRAFAYFATEEHQAVIRDLARYRKPVPLGPKGGLGIYGANRPERKP
jgi:hypothetical protein